MNVCYYRECDFFGASDPVKALCKKAGKETKIDPLKLEDYINSGNPNIIYNENGKRIKFSLRNSSYISYIELTIWEVK